jgi:predicted HD phosphohydrolase
MTPELTDLCERGQTASNALKLARLDVERTEQAVEEAHHAIRDAERAYQKIQEEVRAARFHDVGHLSSYLNAENLAKGDGAKYLPLKEQTR